MTSNLLIRLGQHRTGALRGFASKYRVARLVHFEMLGDMYAAIAREKQLKNWHRAWKVALIEEGNSFWEDRAIELGFRPLSPHSATLIRHPGLDPIGANFGDSGVGGFVIQACDGEQLF